MEDSMDIRHKRTVKLPALPPEIWICVFQHATYVPGTLVPEVYAQFNPTKQLSTKDRHSGLREALLTKRALVCVCKQWWHLATPYLYRSVYIGRVRSIEPLLSTLKSSAMDEERQPLGAYTQRLDVAIRDHVRDDRSNSEEKSKPLTNLISHMTNLIIVSFSMTPNFVYTFPNNILEALERSASSLRVLDFAPNTHQPSVAHLASLLTKCHQLRVLTSRLLTWSNDKTHCHIPTSVTTLKVNALATWPTAFEGVTSSFNWEESGSALRELTIEGQNKLHHWNDFLRCCCSQLHCLQFCIPHDRSIDVRESLHVVARTCPNLRRLIITADRFPAIVRPNLILPPITYLGLRATNNQAIRSDFVSLFSLLDELKTTLPSLQVVQLLSKYNVESLLKCHTRLAARELQPYLEGRTFRIEDQDGVLLTDRLKELGHPSSIGVVYNSEIAE